MVLIQARDYAHVSELAADMIAKQIQQKQNALIGLATGSSPIGTYQNLIAMNHEGQLDFSHVRTVNLDEYVGLSKECDQSYSLFMRKQLFNHINISLENTHIPNGMACDLDAECTRYDQLISNMGGIDLQLLGIGHDGHIGFNEPADSFSTGTNCVTLTETTRKANSRFFSGIENVPTQAITMGIREIMQAKSIVVVVSGGDKLEILKQAIHGPVTPRVPASILQLHHNCTIITDCLLQ